MSEKRGALAEPLVPGLAVDVLQVKAWKRVTEDYEAVIMALDRGDLDWPKERKGLLHQLSTALKMWHEGGRIARELGQGLAGPESAAEHVRNALQLLVPLQQQIGDQVEDDHEAHSMAGDLAAARARLVAALAILEAK